MFVSIGNTGQLNLLLFSQSPVKPVPKSTPTCEYYDNGDHFCVTCCKTSSTLSEHLNHLHSSKHKQVSYLNHTIDSLSSQTFSRKCASVILKALRCIRYDQSALLPPYFLSETMRLRQLYNDMHGLPLTQIRVTSRPQLFICLVFDELNIQGVHKVFKQFKKFIDITTDVGNV